MAVTEFVLITDWRFDAPLDQVWKLIETTEAWPEWWPAVKKVELLKRGGDDDVGTVRRLTWGTALPYTITFDVRTTSVVPKARIEGRAFGELDGVGVWTLREEYGLTHVRYDWRVEVTKPWMRILAPLLRPMFAWNHNKVMNWGYEGARKRLGLP